MKCYSKTKKTPIGVVIDNLNKRAIALDETRITSTVQDLINAGYSKNYGNTIGVPGWDWATANDLNLMKENVDALNAVLSTISGAKVLSKTNAGYVGGEPEIVGGNDTYRVTRCLRELKGIDPESGMYDICTVSVRYDADLSKYDYRVRLVLFYGDCGSYQTSTNGQKCTSVIYNGNTCYKDCRAYTCSDGGYKSKDLPCAKGTSQSVLYKGLTCYHCVGDEENLEPVKETCEDLGFLTPESTTACACTYGYQPVTAKTSSGATKNCARCGTYAECGGGNIHKCLYCRLTADPVNPL